MQNTITALIMFDPPFIFCLVMYIEKADRSSQTISFIGKQTDDFYALSVCFLLVFCLRGFESSQKRKRRTIENQMRKTLTLQMGIKMGILKTV